MSTEEDHGNDTALAGEYVLHLLDDADRIAFEQRMAEEPALKELVREWDEQLSLLTQDIAPVAPPPAVKARLQETLFAQDTARRGSLWGWLAGGLVAAGLVAGTVLLAPVLNPGADPEPAFTASIAAEDGTLVVEARFMLETRTLRVARQTGQVRAGRAQELWLIAEGAEAPVSLGLLSPARETRLTLPERLVAQMANAVLAISDEPAGGSPTGAPTGAVLAVGPVTGL